MVQPLNHLVAVTERISQGHYDIEPVLSRRDELGVLMRKMAAMADSIDQLLKEKELWNQQLEEEVQQRTDELTTANTRLGNSLKANHSFLAHVSHDLRIPLNAILGYSEMILEAEHPDE